MLNPYRRGGSPAFLYLHTVKTLTIVGAVSLTRAQLYHKIYPLSIFFSKKIAQIFHLFSQNFCTNCTIHKSESIHINEGGHPIQKYGLFHICEFTYVNEFRLYPLFLEDLPPASQGHMIQTEIPRALPHMALSFKPSFDFNKKIC